MDAERNVAAMEKGEGAARLEAMGYGSGGRAYDVLAALGDGALGRRLDAVNRAALASPSPDEALANLERLCGALPDRLVELFATDEEALRRVVRLCGASRLLTDTMAIEPEATERLFFGGSLERPKGLDEYRREFGGLLSRKGGDERPSRRELERLLRIYKRREFLRIGARDILGIATMSEVTAELSDLAGALIDGALSVCLDELAALYGRPLYRDDEGREREAAFTVIGLGKLGGRELNFFSDIDILYIYSSDRGGTTGVGGRPGTTLNEFFTRLAERLTAVLSAVTDEGICFRVDLDLRPEGRSGPIANSLRSAEIYYESWGQTWERSALIKARPVAGSGELGRQFLAMVSPFVFRRHLDFTAIEEIKSMKERIDLARLRRSPSVRDVKLGEGGIREIEFFCQALQLIYGGKDPELRAKGTLETIERLVGAGLLGRGEAGDLKEAYVFLRNLEHRIQIVEGRQTHALPVSAAGLSRTARLMGFDDIEAFESEYAAVTARVHKLYRGLFYRAEEEKGPEVPEPVAALFSPEITDEEAEALLRELGFRDPRGGVGKVRLLREGPAHGRIPPRARTLVAGLGPRILHLASASPDPDRALHHASLFLSAVGARTAFYSLLNENPAVTELLVRLFGTSVFLSQAIIEHPENIDTLLSPEISKPRKTRAELDEESAEAVTRAGDYEGRLDALRRFKNQEVLRIGINDITGELEGTEVSAQLTALAEVSLEQAIAIAAAELRPRFGEPSRKGFVIMGLGKLGSGELIYGSDLDLLFVYDDRGGCAETSGPRVITDHEYYVRLGQKIISVLTVPTREGEAFKVDTRLRPSGSAGPLVVSRSSLIAYQTERAEVWERQAMVRARAAAGDISFGEAVTAELFDAVYGRGLSETEASEMVRIRGRMEREIAGEGPGRYNIKTGPGGLVDIEFLVQALQLRHGGREPALRKANTLAAMEALKDNGRLDEEDFNLLVEAYRFLRLVETGLRIVHNRPEGYLVEGSAEVEALARRLGFKDAAPGLLSRYLDHRRRVRSLYKRVLSKLAGGK
ncbi:MAG TPA: bifunctional [glutamate--ammonia ligase]-adenylyl-L-tyrosine phosphorylase/[glutamate--ammonia-ligase] adenylyltransferase [Deltaproteobacteria bacterium]|nr:bifunctional [glutamate--ammonia ligase]-adenylyl-L-tyrosine phosphorylase/[glutamate--ammonia-ligase] adenylyltransferase [Deltaproteobacteria bacterium]